MYSRAWSTVVVALGVLSSSFTAGARGDEGVTLSWKFKKGEVFHYIVEQKTASEGTFGGRQIKTDVRQTMDVRWAIDDVDDDGTAEMTQTITRTRIKASPPNGAAVEYDSASEEAPSPRAAQLAGIFKVLIDKPIRLKMNPRGKVSDVTLPEGMADEMKKAAPGGAGGAMLSEEFFKQMTGASTLEFADHPVKKGDTWKRKATVANPQAGGNQTLDITYTYQGTEKQAGKEIDKIDIAMNTSIAPATANSMKIEVKEQQSEGKVDFDHNGGHVIQTRANVKMVMAITVMGMTFDQTGTNETSMRLAEGADEGPEKDDPKSDES